MGSICDGLAAAHRNLRSLAAAIVSGVCLLTACSPQPKNVAETATTSGPALEVQAKAVSLGLSDKIELVDTPILDGDLAHLAGLQKLRVLKFDHVQVTDEKLAAALKNHSALEEIVIRGDGAGDQTLGALCRLPSVRIINLPGSQLTDDGLEGLEKLPNLTLLRFGSPRVTDQGMEAIGRLKTLRFLHLVDVPITDAGLAELYQLTQLESLYLDGSQVTDAGVGKLFEALPRVHFHQDQQHHDRDPHRHEHSHAASH